MKNAMSKRLTALCLALCLALPLAGCSGKEESSAANRLEAIKERGYLEVVTEPYFAPMEFIDPTKEGDEKYVGADIELAHHIADELGVECHIIPLDFTSVLSGVTTGKYDMAISALAYTPERAEAMELAKRMKAMTLTVYAKGGGAGRLFGSVTSQEIADALQSQGITLDKRKIVIDEPIKNVGTYTIRCKLGYEITAQLTVQIQEKS